MEEELYDQRLGEGWKNLQPIYNEGGMSVASFVHKKKREVSIIDMKENKEILRIALDTFLDELTEEKEFVAVNSDKNISTPAILPTTSTGALFPSTVPN